MLSTRSNNLNTTMQTDVEDKGGDGGDKSNVHNPSQAKQTAQPATQTTQTAQPATQTTQTTQATQATQQMTQATQQMSQDPDKEESSTTVVAEGFHKSEMAIFNKIDDDNPKVRSDDYIIKHINFKLSDAGDTQKFMNNINVSKPNEKKVIVSINGNKYNFYDDAKEHMGSFTIGHLVRYLGEVHDTKKQFMRQFNFKEYTDARELIENFIGTVKYDPRIGYTSIELKGHNDSAFMGDVEMIVKMNRLLHIFLKTKLQDELKYVDPKSRKQIEHTVNQFVYTMLNYTIGLIDIVSSDIKDQPGKRDLAIELVKYSVGTLYRISKFVQEQIAIVMKSNGDIERLLVMSVKMRGIIDRKMNTLIDKIELQNQRLMQRGGQREIKREIKRKDDDSSNDKSESQEIINLNSETSSSSSSTTTTTVELSRSVSGGEVYNFDDESHFSEILNV